MVSAGGGPLRGLGLSVHRGDIVIAAARPAHRGDPGTGPPGSPRIGSVRAMAKLPISHHERVEGHPRRWHVYLHGRSRPIPVELPEDERGNLDLTDEEIHALLPTALQRHAETTPEDVLPGEEYHDVTWDAPVRVMQTHFMA
jgi:hypothetical protein